MPFFWWWAWVCFKAIYNGAGGVGGVATHTQTDAFEYLSLDKLDTHKKKSASSDCSVPKNFVRDL